MVLLDRNFPEEYAKKCQKLTGKATNTEAVKKSLELWFTEHEQLIKTRQELSQVKEQLASLILAIKAREEANQKFEKIFKSISK